MRRNVDWSKWDHLHGSLTAVQMAKMLGITFQRVYNRRRRLRKHLECFGEKPNV
jgi:hypothetical protein